MAIETHIIYIREKLEEISVDLRENRSQLVAVSSQLAQAQMDIRHHGKQIKEIRETNELNTKFREEVWIILKHWKTIVGFIGVSALVTVISTLINIAK